MEKKAFAIALAYISVWVCSCIAICVALYITKDMRCLWFLFLPSFVHVLEKSGDTDDSKEMR